MVTVGCRVVGRGYGGMQMLQGCGAWVRWIRARALKELQKKEDELSKKAGLRRSQSPRRREEGGKAVPKKKGDMQLGRG